MEALEGTYENFLLTLPVRVSINKDKMLERYTNANKVLMNEECSYKEQKIAEKIIEKIDVVLIRTLLTDILFSDIKIPGIPDYKTAALVNCAEFVEVLYEGDFKMIFDIPLSIHNKLFGE